METDTSSTSTPLNLPIEPSHADIAPRSHRFGWIALLSAGPILLAILKLFPWLDQTSLHNPVAHVLISGGASLLGVALALLVLHVAVQSGDARVFLVGMGFLSTASIFLIHSVSTPDVLIAGRNLATSWSAILSLVLGGAFFALSGLELSEQLNSRLMRHARAWLAIYAIFWLVYSLALVIVVPALSPAEARDLAQPSLISEAEERPQAARAGGGPSYGEDLPAPHPAAHGAEASASATTPAPVPDSGLDLLDAIRVALASVGLGCFAFAVARHASLYRRAPSQAGLVITCGIALFGEALLTQQLAQLYSISFWLYHAEEFVGFGVISHAVLRAYQRGKAGEGLLESLLLPGTRARLQAEYAEAMDALLTTLSHGEQPGPALDQTLRGRFRLNESQMRVLEHAGLAVAQERQQRQDLERLNATLRQLERDKEELMQMVVHDLKNPLTALVGFLDMMRMDTLSDSQRYLLESALRSSRNLSGLISDLLDVGRFEEGRLDLERSFFPPRELLIDCATQMSAWILQDSKTIQIEGPDELPILHADLRLMRRVLLNLVSNAIKHTPAGTQIVLRAYPCPDLAPGMETMPELEDGRRGALVIEVEDDGPGIPPEHLDRIFEKFGRINGERVSRQDSTGLGLTFCRLAVEAHGGTIGVASVFGHGTTFRVLLPLAAAALK